MFDRPPKVSAPEKPAQRAPRIKNTFRAATGSNRRRADRAFPRTSSTSHPLPSSKNACRRPLQTGARPSRLHDHDRRAVAVGASEGTRGISDLSCAPPPMHPPICRGYESRRAPPNPQIRRSIGATSAHRGAIAPLGRRNRCFPSIRVTITPDRSAFHSPSSRATRSITTHGCRRISRPSQRTIR